MLPEIAVGAIIAAIIGAMISLVGLIVTKEAKVSEFRQAWIDSLRTELASFASSLNALSDANVIDFESPKERFEQLKDHTIKLNESFFSVALRLNVNEESSDDVRSSMVKLANSVRNPDLFVKQSFDQEQVQFIKVSNILLKKEWARVKAGENVYRWTRLTAVATIAFLTTSVILILGTGLMGRKPNKIKAAIEVPISSKSRAAYPQKDLSDVHAPTRKTSQSR
jgi:hypothetical protein